MSLLASMPFHEVFQHPFFESLGWTLLHSLWQGVGVAVLLWIVLVSLRRASANVRYLVCCMAFLVLAVLPAVTLVFLGLRETPSKGVPQLVGELSQRPVQNFEHLPAAGTTGSVVAPSEPGLFVPQSDVPDIAIHENSVASVVEVPESIILRIERLLRPWLPRLTMLWCCGVVLLSMRLIVAWFRVERLKNTAADTTDAAKTDLLLSLSARLGVTQFVRLLESSLVEVPTVIGWLKPVILLPIATVNSLTLSQLESILAHELAHIRRADYVINLFQSVIETLLFYHPAVWWISSNIRQEREHCCDDLAASINGDKAGYVAALVRMEELRGVPRGVAVAARGGNLLIRVRRLLQPPSPDRLSAWWLTGLVTSLIVVSFIALPFRAKLKAESTVAQESQSKNKNDSAESDDASSNSRGFPRSAQSRLGRASEKLAIVEGLDNITPAQIADRIEEIWKQYQSIEYTATIEETRNSSPFGDKPTLVDGTGTTVFRTDGTRWFADESSFTYRQGTTETTSTHTMSAFNGERHRIRNRNGVLIEGEDDLATRRWSPTLLFWEAGISADWLLGALRRPEAELVERVKTAETTCLHVRSSWTPEWSDVKHSFDIMICPEQSWLPRQVLIEHNGDMAAEWKLGEITTTESRLHYPGEIKSVHPDRDFRPKRTIRITSFRERNDFKPEEFEIPLPADVDVVDRRAGFSWYNDPWWDELAPWARENLQWPQPDLQPLLNLTSYSNLQIVGKTAPPLNPGESLTDPPIKNWNPERNVTVLYFFGGMLESPNPQQLKALDHLYRRYRDGGLDVIGIASHRETMKETRQAVRELNLSLPVFIDRPASESQIQANPKAAHSGATYAAYELSQYTGVIVIDGEGTVQFVDPQTPDLPNGMSHLEWIVRKELLKANGTSDPPGLRQQTFDHASRILRGKAADGAELTAVVIDKSPLWLQTAEQKIVETIPDAQREFFNSHRLKVQNILQDLNQNSGQISNATAARLEDEWKRRARAASGTGAIRGFVRENTDGEFSGCKATVIVESEFRMLFSNNPGGWRLSKDSSRQRKIDTDDNGSFTIDNLPKGSYQITIAAPGRPLAERTVNFVNHDSETELTVDLRGTDTISGRVTDATGNVIANATVKAIKRFVTFDSMKNGFYTTAHLPASLETDTSGNFAFESLFETAYVFEVSADGYETATTGPTLAGASMLSVKLNPQIDAPAESAPK